MKEQTVETWNLIDKIKDNAHLIAADFECTESILNDETGSRYSKDCAQRVFFERFRELIKGNEDRTN